MSRQIDAVDKEILSILLLGAATPKAEIGRRVGIAASAVSERVRRLEREGVIQRYEARLTGATLHRPLLAYVFVRETKPNTTVDTAGALVRVTGVEEVHKIAGEDCYLVKVRTRGTEDLATLLDEEIGAIPSVAGVRTTIVLRTLVEGPPLVGSPAVFVDDGGPAPSEAVAATA